MERALRFGGFALLAGLVAGCLWTARHQWFYGDDFALLSQVQLLTPWDWWNPLGPHPWLFYRPLGMHTYYDVCLALFGLAPLPYLGVALATGVACVAVVGSIARRLALSPAGVRVTQIALLSSLASLGLFVSATTFHYLAALLATALALRLFVAGTAPALVASCAFLVVGLLCNEIAAIVPVGALALALWPEARRGVGARRLAARIAPLAAIVLVYVSLRFSVLAGELPWGYTAVLSERVPGIIALQLSMGLGGARALAVLGLALALLLATRTRVALPGAALLGLGAWTLLAVLPFSLMFVPRPAIPIVLPIALGLGLCADRFWAAFAQQRAPACALAVGVLALALIPVERLQEQARNPRGAIGRDLYRVIREHGVDAHTTAFLVLHGAPGLAEKKALDRIKWSLHGYGDRFEKALFPARGGVRPVRIRFVDVARGESLPPWVDRCVYLAARADGRVEVADAETVGALAPELRNRCDLRAG